MKIGAARMASRVRSAPNAAERRSRKRWSARSVCRVRSSGNRSFAQTERAWLQFAIGAHAQACMAMPTTRTGNRRNRHYIFITANILPIRAR
ncbi:hypothetical protein C6P92_04980 [Burkholderia multivorans]|nr:hypothetical protein C6P92_04980 [Burkholderia multivorans]